MAMKVILKLQTVVCIARLRQSFEVPPPLGERYRCVCGESGVQSWAVTPALSCL